ncbi:uncharacterized protein SPSK_05208 [Sporothrix schenckii 1099-18]|uniref:Uncharacterized protein n=1 Tax=Sporothrix schenckii 1099-18 TaxID=1397361 RepID=A0A0F2LXA4_SPOSC|nr:uncharacterized protein SPSK_05208 [Sporothrix schenckii 1099-18]KJR81130.1 hypothetical protein SPSK_05208 [Sporothrix schenckii 1099-18]
MTAAPRPQMTPDDDDVGTTFLLSRMDGHTHTTQEQPAGSPLSSDNDNDSLFKTKTAPLTSASSPSLSLMPPPLPQRDARRKSCFLDAMLDPKTALSADMTVTPTTSKAALTSAMTSPPTPLDVYLSSEEDASSLGDLSDFDFDSDEFDDYGGEFEEATATSAAVIARTATNNSAPAAVTTNTTSATASLQNNSTAAATTATHTRRHSHDIARVVSVVYAGKPSLVDLGVEREARRQSLHNARSPSSSASSVVLSETRPSTSSGGSMLSTAPSSTVSPAKHQQKRNSSSSASIGSISIGGLGGNGMLASFSARKLALTAAAVTATTNSNSASVGRSRAPVLPSLKTTATVAAVPSPAAPESAVDAIAAVSAPIMAAPARSYTTSVLVAGGESTVAASSPRTPTFGTAGLLRGMTRSLRVSTRRGLGRRESMVEKVRTPTSATAVSPTLLPDTPGNRKSLALSVVSSMTLMNAPPPGPPNEDAFDGNDSMAATTPRRLATPTDLVVSRKSSGGSFLGNLAGRRRSLRLL